jgi:hypothetical protein
MGLLNIIRRMHLRQKLSIREIARLTGVELSLKVGDGGIGWHIKALLTRRSSRREKDMPHDEGYGCRVSRARRVFARPADGFAPAGGRVSELVENRWRRNLRVN